MPATHYWGDLASGALYDQGKYGIGGGTAFVPSDTLIISSGNLEAISKVGPFDAYGYSLGIDALLPGNYVFDDRFTTGKFFDLSNERLISGTTFAVNGSGLDWFMDRTVINDGLIQVGSASGPGNAAILLTTELPLVTGYTGPNGFVNAVPLLNGTKVPSLVFNNGTIGLQNNSTLSFNPDASGSTIVNATSGVIKVDSGSILRLNTHSGTQPGSSGSANIANEGLINITGVAGRKTYLLAYGVYSGNGKLSVHGVAGQSSSDTFAELVGPASGTFEVASGGIRFDTTPVSGSVNFLDNNANLTVNAVAGTSYGAGPKPFGAALNGFQAGDGIDVQTSTATSGHNYDPATHLLTLVAADGSVLAQFTLNGAYMPDHINVVAVGGVTGQAGAFDAQVTTIATPASAPAPAPVLSAPSPFAYVDRTTGASGGGGQAYDASGMSYLQSQYIWASPHDVSIVAGTPNAFIKSGAGNDVLAASAGSNVLDGGTGANILVGASGADGGIDTFFLNGRDPGSTWDTLLNFHPGDSVTLWDYAPGQSTMSWADNDGANGLRGATIHAAFAGPTVNGSVTFAGIALADAQSKFTLSTGTVGGKDYLWVHYNT